MRTSYPDNPPTPNVLPDIHIVVVDCLKPNAELAVVAEEASMTNTRERVPDHTDEQVNRRIRAIMKRNVHYYSLHRHEIPRRLRELDEEWDIERAIEANAAAIAFTGIALSVTRGRGWLVLPALVTGFLFQHAVQGWCPPIPVLRRLGFRTSYEIEEERQALKALRGDFEASGETGGQALRAAAA